MGSFADNRVKLNRTLLKDYNQYGAERISYHKAQCKRGDICTQCLRGDEQIYYKPGDLVIVAAFPIHNVGTKSLECGGLRNTVGLDVAFTVEYAVEQINNDSTNFDGASIGFLLLDTCNDPLVIQEKVLRLYKNGYPGLPSDITSRILGFVGSLGSTPTISMISVTKELEGKPQVMFKIQPTSILLYMSVDFVPFENVSLMHMHMETSPFHMKGCKFRPMLCTHGYCLL